MSHSLYVQSVSARRGGRMIFADVSLAAASGEVVLITGPNGSGKSTLLRLIAGLGEPDNGCIHRMPEEYASLRFLGHRDGMKGALTVSENLAFWSALQNSGMEAVNWAMDQLALNSVADMPVDTLSAGWRRRTGLARLIIGHAPIWILDEPYTSLDSDNISRVDSLITTHLGSGGIVVIASHQTPSFAATHSIDMAAHPAPVEDLEW